MSDHNEKASPLRAARMSAGLSLDALAARSGVSKGALHAAEMNPEKLSDRTAAAVAAALQIPKSLLRTKMSLPAIDVTHAVPWARAAAKRLPDGHPARVQVLETLAAKRRIVASLGVLGAAPDPENPEEVGKVLVLALGAKRRSLESGAQLATSDRSGRKYVLGEVPDGLAVMLELEWRVGKENVEIEVFSRPPEPIQ